MFSIRDRFLTHSLSSPHSRHFSTLSILFSPRTRLVIV